jgi:hypothetical protein
LGEHESFPPWFIDFIQQDCHVALFRGVIAGKMRDHPVLNPTLALPVAHRIGAGSTRNRQEPRHDVAVRVTRVRRAKGAQVCLLHEVVSIVARPQCSTESPYDSLGVENERFGRPVIALASCLKQVGEIGR